MVHEIVGRTIADILLFVHDAEPFCKCVRFPLPPFSPMNDGLKSQIVAHPIHRIALRIHRYEEDLHALGRIASSFSALLRSASVVGQMSGHVV